MADQAQLYDKNLSEEEKARNRAKWMSASPADLQAILELITEVLKEKTGRTEKKDEDEFRDQKRRCTRKDSFFPKFEHKPVAISNRFTILQDENMDTGDTEQQEQEEKAETEQEKKKDQVETEKKDQVGNIKKDQVKNEIKTSETRSQRYTKAKSDEANVTATPDRQPRISPIYLKDKEKWMDVSRLLRSKAIYPAKSRLVATGIQVTPETEDDYRKIRKLFEDEKIEFYTYQLRSEKSLKVVMRGIAHHISMQTVAEDLDAQGYPANKITRMNGKLGKPAPMVLIDIDKEYKSIYTKVTECCGLAVTIEAMRVRDDIIQCHKCQAFGHSQKNCHITHKCMKCGDSHSTHECRKPTTTPPKCANCGGEHLSIYLGCPKNPNNPDTLKKTIPAPPPKINAWDKRREEHEKKQKNLTTQSATPKIRESQTTNDKEERLAMALGKMVIEFNKTNATVEQKIIFLDQTQEITKILNIQ